MCLVREDVRALRADGPLGARARVDAAVRTGAMTGILPRGVRPGVSPWALRAEGTTRSSAFDDAAGPSIQRRVHCHGRHRLADRSNICHAAWWDTAMCLCVGPASRETARRSWAEWVMLSKRRRDRWIPPAHALSRPHLPTTLTRTPFARRLENLSPQSAPPSPPCHRRVDG